MNWNTYLHLKDKHSFLSPSKVSWIRYDTDRLKEVYLNHQRTVLGTKIHKLAEDLIRLSIRLPNNTQTLNMFVNDAIGFKMDPEVVLYYSNNAFGTADAISFRDNVLRIHDLKTGTTPGKMEQLEIYAAMFCLEYDTNPKDIDIILRIYQNDEVVEWFPTTDTIESITLAIKNHNKIIDNIKGV